MIWSLPDSPAARLQLAYGYPYGAPSDGYLLRDSEPAPLERGCFEGRVPVLAHGSNRAPEQLARKFPSGDIPVTCGWLKDHAVAYAACLTRYGACPSLLLHRPGVKVLLSLTWLTREQLAIMHRTEGNYRFGKLEADFAPLEGPEPQTLYLYHGKSGILLLRGGAVGLAAVSSRGDRLPQQLRQKPVLAELHRLADTRESLDDFVLRMIDNAQERRRFNQQLAKHSLVNRLPGFHALAELAAPTLTSCPA